MGESVSISAGYRLRVEGGAGGVDLGCFGGGPIGDELIFKVLKRSGTVHGEDNMIVTHG